MKAFFICTFCQLPAACIMRCWCGTPMTAAYSKGRNKYYLYYKCQHHKSDNFPGEKLHTMMEDIMELLSFSEKQVDHIVTECKDGLKDHFKESLKMLPEGEKQRERVEQKIHNQEEKWMNEPENDLSEK